jgi:hypothetical protein
VILLLDDLFYNGVEYSMLISIDVILLLDDLFYNGVKYSMLISIDVMTGVRYDLNLRAVKPRLLHKFLS